MIWFAFAVVSLIIAGLLLYRWADNNPSSFAEWLKGVDKLTELEITTYADPNAQPDPNAEPARFEAFVAQAIQVNAGYQYMELRDDDHQPTSIIAVACDAFYRARCQELFEAATCGLTLDTPVLTLFDRMREDGDRLASARVMYQDVECILLVGLDDMIEHVRNVKELV